MIDHVYIHIPFCKYICAYCDFCKKYIKHQNPDEYLRRLKKEIKDDYLIKNKISSLYVGGGTPSSLSLKQLKYFSKIISDNFEFKEEYEFSFECNPDDINEEMLIILKSMGVNRLCIGMQTLNDELLHYLKRGHSSKDCENAIDMSLKYFDNISVDFIFNLPNQTTKDIKKSIGFIQKYKNVIKNVSYYSLILEKNTILDVMKHRLLDEEAESDIYYEIVDSLLILEYDQYEISNFSRIGYQSIHNLAYWNQKQYYGFGLGASGYVDNIRYKNTASMKDYYLSNNLKVEKEQLSLNDIKYEKIFLNLRTTKGIEKKFMDSLNIEYDINDFDIKNEMMSIKKEKLFISSEIIVSILSQL